MAILFVFILMAAVLYAGYISEAYAHRERTMYPNSAYDKWTTDDKPKRILPMDDAEDAVIVTEEPTNVVVGEEVEMDTITSLNLNKPIATKELWNKFMVDRELHRRRTGVSAGEKGDLLFVDWSKNNIAD